LHLICAYSCACLHCISFKFDMYACVVYASCRIWLIKWKLAFIGW
jgi:hypothetical protein